MRKKFKGGNQRRPYRSKGKGSFSRCQDSSNRGGAPSTLTSRATAGVKKGEGSRLFSTWGPIASRAGGAQEDVLNGVAL